MGAETLYNATVTCVRDGADARVIHVVPDGPKVRHVAGQYGSLGLRSDVDPTRLIKRPYSLSSSMLDLTTGQLIHQQETPYYEFYFNRVDLTTRTREPLTPKLFTLQRGARIFCSQKIVGYYTLQDVPRDRHLLLIDSVTGESANNALVAQALRERPGVRVAQLLIANNGWRSLYEEEHAALMRRYATYRYLTVCVDSYEAAETRLMAWQQDGPRAQAELGFALDPRSCHLFLCGDPALIGAPTKHGAWRYDVPTNGLIPILTARGFTLHTRFRPGTMDYEAYW